MGHQRRGRTATAAALVVLLGGCSTGSPEPAPAAPDDTHAVERTTLETYDTAGVTVERSPFCDRVSPTGIEHALDQAATSHRDYGNGDRIQLPDGSRTLAHEYGCAWTGEGVTARAWVFVPPVTRGRAGRLVEEALDGRCRRTGSGGFGTPSVATRCRTDEGVERSWRGRFGDAWLVCALAGRDASVVTERRTSEWCVSVLDAART
ncbi:hypothetical protein [Nocardioides sp. GXQ0305]|uniref:hypothetical protein n=1 Tax=Nocardioides sp. GXQ0305 TaxID=3423912 RepID=UPI003D7EF433